MKIAFNIRYRTRMGESICVVIRGEEPLRLELSTYDGDLWQGVLDYPITKRTEKLEYNYALYSGSECLRSEIITIPHTIELDRTMSGGYRVDDIWRDLPNENYRYSTAFNSFTEAEAQPQLTKGRYVTFRVLSPALTREGKRLAIVGNTPELGSWADDGAIDMREVSTNLWSVSLPVSDEMNSFEYKFVAIDNATNKIAHWESGDNRTMSVSSIKSNENYIVAESEVVFSHEQIRVAGSAIPIFSLRSKGGAGVGDFGDLKEYIGWAAKTGQQAVQILPINDTTINNTWQDSYPYNSISIYAFHPMYIDLRALPALKSKIAMHKFEAEREELNALHVIDYERVNKLKRDYIRSIFEQVGDKTLKSKEFKSFFEKNSHWLLPYAAFSFLRDESGTANFGKWKRFKVYNADKITALCSPESADYQNIAFYYYMQYLLHVQLLEAANLARSLGVILKGDIPIGISRESVEAWVEPHYFNMNGQAGAPPDAFSVNGQNWGFPTYNWEVMQQDNFLWWRRRFAKMSEYFTAYRIDHILGFFRIWEIPQHSVHGLLGQFAPAMPMSTEEIESWGLHFQEEFMTKPFINDHILFEIFGEKCDMVREKYLKHLHHDIYTMRDEFATQRQIEAHFRKAKDEKSLQLKEALYSLVSNVLFVEDRHGNGGYHPRISVQSDYIFRQLSHQEQEAFNRLYNHYFYERHNDFWYREAMKKLPVLTCSTSMLVCGEDLGMVPDCVPPVMRELQIISLEIERMPKDPRDEFGHPAHYPYSSVCTIGTHDMSTLRGWWQEDKDVSSKYFYNELGMMGEAPAEAPVWLCEHVVRRHLNSPSMLVILTWQDWLSIDEHLRNPDIEGERINIPANPRHYWRWRMHISLEDLLEQESLNHTIAEFISRSRRS